MNVCTSIAYFIIYYTSYLYSNSYFKDIQIRDLFDISRQKTRYSWTSDDKLAPNKTKS